MRLIWISIDTIASVSPWCGAYGPKHVLDCLSLMQLDPCFWLCCPYTPVFLFSNAIQKDGIIADFVGSIVRQAEWSFHK